MVMMIVIDVLCVKGWWQLTCYSNAGDGIDVVSVVTTVKEEGIWWGEEGGWLTLATVLEAGIQYDIATNSVTVKEDMFSSNANMAAYSTLPSAFPHATLYTILRLLFYIPPSLLPDCWWYVGVWRWWASIHYRGRAVTLLWLPDPCVLPPPCAILPVQYIVTITTDLLWNQPYCWLPVADI